MTTMEAYSDHILYVRDELFEEALDMLESHNIRPTRFVNGRYGFEFWTRDYGLARRLLAERDMLDLTEHTDEVL